MADRSRADQVLFCPFCRESVEDAERCPEHDLPLVPWHVLRPEPGAGDDARRLRSLRVRRGLLAACAAVISLAFVFAPLAVVRGGALRGGSMLALAIGGAHRLWLVPAAAAALLATVVRRRDETALRRARFALAVPAVVAPAAVVWAWAGVRDAVALLGQQRGEQLTLDFGWGAACVALAGCVALVTALKAPDAASRADT